MLFDFQSYLFRIDPTQSYTIVTLSGGVVNVTVRATKELPPPPDGGRFPGHQTLVLKYAPPFVAGVGQSLPFSTFRQTVEARALALFGSPDGLFHDLCSETAILVPQLLHHDDEPKVLIMSDLGRLQTLSNYLFPVAGASALKDAQPSERKCRQLGSRLGQFFARLHAPDTLKRLERARLAQFTEFSTDSLVFETAVEPVEKRLQMFNVEDASELSERVNQDFKRDDRIAEQAFQLGDLWTGGILVNAYGEDGNALGVIDWEFSGIGRGVNGDMAQFLADLHLHLMSSPVDTPSHAASKALIQGIVESYRLQSRRSRAQWVLPASSAAEASNYPPPAPSSAAAHVMRSAFTLHGRELVNLALWKDWPGQASEKEHCPLTKKMVERGAWYIGVAGADERAFLELDNWKEVLAEEGGVIRGLFLGD